MSTQGCRPSTMCILMRTNTTNGSERLDVLLQGLAAAQTVSTTSSELPLSTRARSSLYDGTMISPVRQFSFSVLGTIGERVITGLIAVSSNPCSKSMGRPTARDFSTMSSPMKERGLCRLEHPSQIPRSFVDSPDETDTRNGIVVWLTKST